MSHAAAAMIERLVSGRPASSNQRHHVPLDILVVDDDQATRLSLAYALSDAGHHVLEASDGEEAIAIASERIFDVAVLDVRLPKVDGLTIFRRLRQRAPSTAVILMTAYATIQDAVASLREGAYDYVSKPFDPEEMTLRVIGHISEHVSLKRELEEARRVVASREAGSPIIGGTPAMIRLVERVNTVAYSDAPVLISGEPGTGKELVAHTIHARGPRKAAPFVCLDCSAFPGSVVDAELFGEERATSAARRRGGRIRQAEGGTLFLEKVTCLPLSTQAQLLRVLEEGVVFPVGATEPLSVNVRIVASTEVDPKTLIPAERFRSDLYFRLNVLDLHVPPLRERRADLPLLTAHFLRRYCHGRVPPNVGARAWEALLDHAYPGNVRELAHALERAVVLARGAEIDAEHLPEDIVGRGSMSEHAAKIEPLAVAAKEFEKRHVVRALRLAGDEPERAAELLGISVKTLKQKIERHGIGRDLAVASIRASSIPPLPPRSAPR